MPASDRLRAELAYRIRTASPREWSEFGTLWTAFNAIYGGEPDQRERSRVMACLRRHFTNGTATQVLRAVRRSVDQILALPPGNLLIDRYDPNFRAASRRYAAMYRNPRETPISRVAAVGAVLYQIRCNLIHGDKDPQAARDRMLVQESLAVLQVLVPALEARINAP